jgi:hypothetical protein
MDSSLPRPIAASPTQYNIEAIAKLEHDALDRRTPTERVSDVITKLVGNIVACCWMVYAFATAPDYEIQTSGADRLVWILAVITCPANLTDLRYYWVVPLNAATYDLVGALVGRLPRR